MTEKNVEGTKMQEFFNEYKKLCDNYGCMITVTPAFKARDDGTWSVVLQTGIGKLNKKQKI